MHYSKSTGGFYDTVIHGDNIPTDAVEITAEYHAELLQAQSTGKQITADDNGYPIAIEHPVMPTDIYARWKAERMVKVEAIKVEVGGMTFDGDETSQTRMSRAIVAMQNAGVLIIDWTLADNSVVKVSAMTLSDALLLASTEQTRIWNDGRPA